MEEKRDDHAVCLQGERIIAAGGYDGSEYFDTCEAFDTTSKRFVLPTIVLLLTIQLMFTSYLLAAGRPCRG